MQEIQTIKITDVNYPTSLKELKDAPKILYYKGNIEALKNNCFAVVGTRRPTSYGHQAALKITEELSKSGLTIVSGLAPGIDTAAHKTCVENKNPTVAVLGTGLDKKSIYPKENLRLAEKIIENGGCLISELKPETHGSKFTFPKRNRLVSALSLGVLVIEAKERSGSLITARYAKQQNKKLFAVPGQIYTLNAKGTNNLIKSGAILTESAKDILLALKIQNLVNNNRDLLNFSIEAENPIERAILTALKEEPLAIDKIIELTKLEASDINTSIAVMEISGKIRNLGGNIYSIA